MIGYPMPVFRASGLIQGIHFRKCWRNGIYILKLDADVGADDSNDADLCYDNCGVLEG
jgi:hypothetical protein